MLDKNTLKTVLNKQEIKQKDFWVKESGDCMIGQFKNDIYDNLIN